MSLNIEELKKSMEVNIKKVIMTCIKEAIAGEISDEDNADSGVEMVIKSIQPAISLCQLVCEVSDSLPPKLEMTTKNMDEQRTYQPHKCGYNQRREEDLLWLTKKMMGLRDFIFKILNSPNIDVTLRHDEKVMEYISKTIANALKQDMGVRV